MLLGACSLIAVDLCGPPKILPLICPGDQRLNAL